MLTKLFSNPTKELLKEYFFWVDFVSDFDSVDGFKKKLETIKDKKIYKNSFAKFFLTLEESKALHEEVEELSIEEILNSNTYPLFLLERLERITLYDKKDLKYISKKSQMIWTSNMGVYFHLILENKKVIYPKDYNQDNEYRFGYSVFRNHDGVLGVYGIEKEKLVLGFEYSFIKLFGNIAIISYDNKNYYTYNLDEDKIISQTKNINTLDIDIRKYINYSKIELSAYMQLFEDIKTQNDLVKIGLWNTKVAVIEVPLTYRDIIENSNEGIIRWEYPISGDTFNMSIELPVEFKKRNGEYITLGIKHEHLILQKEYRNKLKSIKHDFKKEKEVNISSFQDLLKRGNLPYDNREVPLWLQIKNDTLKDIPTTKDFINEIVSLEDGEFMNYINKTINQNIFFTALSSAKDEELEVFYAFCEKGLEGLSLQFKEKVEEFSKKDTTKEQKEFALAVGYLYKEEAKNTLHQYLRLFEDMNQSNFSKDDESLFELEYSINSIFFHEGEDFTKKFKEFITLIKKLYEEDKLSHEFCLHIASKFSPFITSLYEVSEDKGSLKWFMHKFINEDLEILRDESSLHQLIIHHYLRHEAILQKDEDKYLDNTITIVRYLFAFYPYINQSAFYYLDEVMKFVSQKEISEDNANAFIEIFEVLAVFYKNTSYEKIMEFKEFVNERISSYKPQDNSVFEKVGVKNKIILLNYLLDMEDLYFESLGLEDKNV